jgi:hypothetical protein
MEETTQKIQGLKKRSMKLSEEARELMRTAKGEQKKIRTRGLCIVGGRLLSVLGIRDIEGHQKIFESICADRRKVDELISACLKKLVQQQQQRQQE